MTTFGDVEGPSQGLGIEPPTSILAGRGGAEPERSMLLVVKRLLRHRRGSNHCRAASLHSRDDEENEK